MLLTLILFSVATFLERRGPLAPVRFARFTGQCRNGFGEGDAIEVLHQGDDIAASAAATAVKDLLPDIDGEAVIAAPPFGPAELLCPDALQFDVAPGDLVLDADGARTLDPRIEGGGVMTPVPEALFVIVREGGRACARNAPPLRGRDVFKDGVTAQLTADVGLDHKRVGLALARRRILRCSPGHSALSWSAMIGIIMVVRRSTSPGYRSKSGHSRR